MKSIQRTKYSEKVSLTKAHFNVRSAEVVIVCPETSENHLVFPLCHQKTQLPSIIPFVQRIGLTIDPVEPTHSESLQHVW